MVTIKEDWVEFRFYRPLATRVTISGDFNGWQHDELTMLPDKEGYWHTRMKLPAGEYRFRYCADGNWFTDFAAFGVEPGQFGLDSVVRVVTSLPKLYLDPSQPAKPSVAAVA